MMEGLKQYKFPTYIRMKFKALHPQHDYLRRCFWINVHGVPQWRKMVRRLRNMMSDGYTVSARRRPK